MLDAQYPVPCSNNKYRMSGGSPCCCIMLLQLLLLLLLLPLLQDRALRCLHMLCLLSLHFPMMLRALHVLPCLHQFNAHYLTQRNNVRAHSAVAYEDVAGNAKSHFTPATEKYFSREPPTSFRTLLLLLHYYCYPPGGANITIARSNIVVFIVTTRAAC